MGLTLLNTNPTCGLFGYCLNINANWSPLTTSNQPFDPYELQVRNPPYSFQQAHCQENNMDDSPNTDFTNCPTSRDDGQHVSYVKCMTWQLGHDGLNAGKWGTIEKSFVRTVDDAIKPWDSHGIYKDITIWQLALGWPINFGWWNWNQPDVGTIVDSIYVIHNHNWITSPNWPATASGQCTVGGIYGSGALKSGYRLSNIFVETAASCAVGLEISDNAYSKHLTEDGCVANIVDTRIDGMYFDEPFYKTGGYTNYLSGEKNPKNNCSGDYAGEIKDMVISGSVAGRPLSKADFVVHDNTVPGLKFESPPPDPHPSAPYYQKYERSNAYQGVGAGAEIGEGVEVFSSTQCLDRCQADWSCDCVVYSPSESTCWKRKNCQPSAFDADPGYDVYLRLWDTTPEPAPTAPPVSPPTGVPTPAPTEAPVPAPTAAPQPLPTLAPVPAPTGAPTPTPTEAPVPSPTATPTQVPTPAPQPLPTEAPFSTPTAAPVPAPTLAPQRQPTSPPVPAPECSDSKDLAYNDYAWKDCDWVGRKYFKRCFFSWKGRGLWEWCPEACRECTCADDKNLKYKRNENYNCDWVAKNKARCDREWKGHTLDYFCPVTCETCDAWD